MYVHMYFQFMYAYTVWKCITYINMYVCMYVPFSLLPCQPQLEQSARLHHFSPIEMHDIINMHILQLHTYVRTYVHMSMESIQSEHPTVHKYVRMYVQAGRQWNSDNYNTYSHSLYVVQESQSSCFDLPGIAYSSEHDSATLKCMYIHTMHVQYVHNMVYVRIYVCTHSMLSSTGSTYVCMHIRTYVCIYVGM